MQDTTDTDIANRALEAIGETFRITDLQTDDTARGRALKNQYEPARRTVLEEYPWNFSAGRASLPEYGVKPAFGGGRYFALPADCIKVREVYDAHPYEQWSVELVGADETMATKCIIIDRAAPLNIIYSRDIKRLSLWSELALDAFAAKLALHVAMPITQKASMRSDAAQLYQMAMAQASLQDAQEGSNFQLDTGPWVQARW